MRINRNYSQLSYGRRRRGNSSVRLILTFGLVIVGIVAFVYLQFDRLQTAALAVVGIYPTATPFASTLAAQGAEQYARGNLIEAAGLLERAVAQQPDNVSYLYEYGKLLNELDRSDAAVPLADRIIGLAPDDPRGYALKANALMWTDPSTAIPVAVNGLEADPTFAPLHSALAIAYTNIGRYQEGIVRAQTAVELEPMDPSAHRAYSYTLIYVGRREEAIAQLEQAIDVNPYLTSIYFELAGQYRTPEIDRPEMAVAIYYKILELEPDSAKAYLRLCETYSAEGEFQQAQEFCEQAIEIDPNFALAYRELGRMQYNRRNYEDAIVSFETCVDLGATPDNAIECWYLRGLALYYLDNCDEAWEVLQDALGKAEALVDKDPVVENINKGLGFITLNCAGYAGRALPTPIPPTPIPPTPIGGGA